MLHPIPHFAGKKIECKVREIACLHLKPRSVWPQCLPVSAPAFLWVSSRLLHVRTSWEAFKTTSTSDSGGVGLTPQNVHGSAAWASPESWAAMQNLRPRPTHRICSPSASPHQNVGRTGQLPSWFECSQGGKPLSLLIWDLIPIFFSPGNIHSWHSQTAAQWENDGLCFSLQSTST